MADELPQLPLLVDWNIVQGTTWKISLDLADSDGVAFPNLTGWTFAASLKDEAGTVVFNAAAFTVTVAASSVEFKLTNSQTLTLTADAYTFGAEGTVSGEVYALIGMRLARIPRVI